MWVSDQSQLEPWSPLTGLIELSHTPRLAALSCGFAFPEHAELRHVAGGGAPFFSCSVTTALCGQTVCSCAQELRRTCSQFWPKEVMAWGSEANRYGQTKLARSLFFL